MRKFVSRTTTILCDAEGRVGSVQDGSTATHALLPDEGAGAFLVVVFVQTRAAVTGAHARLILLARGASQCCETTGTRQRRRSASERSIIVLRHLTAEIVPPPADADLMCVADCHVGRQEVTLVILVVQVARPHDVTELLWRHLYILSSCKL